MLVFEFNSVLVPLAHLNHLATKSNHRLFHPRKILDEKLEVETGVNLNSRTGSDFFRFLVSMAFLALHFLQSEAGLYVRAFVNARWFVNVISFEHDEFPQGFLPTMAR